MDEELEKALLTESLFYKYICKKYLEIIKEPRTELLDLFMKASNDLKIIDETLNDIHGKREKIVKDNVAQDVQEKLPILFYYKELNEKAKEEILHFIKNDIKNFALENSMDIIKLTNLNTRMIWQISLEICRYRLLEMSMKNITILTKPILISI